MPARLPMLWSMTNRGAGDAHWNEESRALIAGLIMMVVASEPPHLRHPATLRDYLTKPPRAFADLLTRMQESTSCDGLIARAANRHLGKSDREASGVLSSAQRHTPFLDSRRMKRVMERSDFCFTDLKQRTQSVFLVLPPDRLGTYARWLRLMISQSLTEMVNARKGPPQSGRSCRRNSLHRSVACPSRHRSLWASGRT